jgi:pimeloyl-ACP methyl ester carboxylesterase
MALAPQGMKSHTVDLDGPVHYVDFGGSGRPIVLVHGLGGSHLNWLPVGLRLAAHGRVLALDLAGHGRTPSVGRTARVDANRRLLGRFLETVAGAPAILMGNSMGGYLSMAEAAAEPDKVASLVLVAPAVPNTKVHSWHPVVLALFAGYALPGIGRTLMRWRYRRGPERLVRDTLRLCCVDASRIPSDAVLAHVELARERMVRGRLDGRDFLTAQRSLMAELVRPRRFYEMVAQIRAPGLIVQGGRDRLVRVAAARVLAAARPDWRFEMLEGVGHVPQLEAPERFLAAVEPWLGAPEPRRRDPTPANRTGTQKHGDNVG